jgi:hypothetical protein
MDGKMRVPPANAFDYGGTDRESLCCVLTFFTRVRCIEPARRIARMPAQAQAAQLR